MDNINQNKSEELKDKFKDAIGCSDFHVPEFITGIPMADGSEAYQKILDDETDSLANECVRIVENYHTETLATVSEVDVSGVFIDRMERPDLSESNEDACFEIGASAMRSILLPQLAKHKADKKESDENWQKEFDILIEQCDGWHKEADKLQQENEQLTRDLKASQSTADQLAQHLDFKMKEIEQLKKALVGLAKESEDLMDFCIDRKYLDNEDKTDGQILFDEALNAAKELLTNK